MSFTRKSIADHLDSYDDEIAELQTGKRDTLNDYRHQLAVAGMTKQQIKGEIEALKIAMRRRRTIAKTSETEVEEADALADEIFAEITARAPRATRAREIIEEFDPETGETTEHEQPETAHETHERPSTNAEASPEADPQAEAFQSHGTGAGTLAGHEGRSEGEEASVLLPTNPPSAATPASGTISPSSDSQGVTGGNPSEPSPDAGAEDEPAPAGRKNAQSEQAAHHFYDDVPAFLKQDQPRKTMADYRPHCQHPEACAASGLQHCYSCSKLIAARESEVA